MLDPNATILEHEQEWTCPSTGVTYYRTTKIARTIDPDYGADADGNRGERRAFYELDSVSFWHGDGMTFVEGVLEAYLTEDDRISFDELPTPEQICDRIAETDEW